MRGFTVKELLMVIIVISILCFAAIPTYYSMQNARLQTQMDTVVMQIQSGLKEQNIEPDSKIKFPLELDSEPLETVCSNCFTMVLEKGISNDLWFKKSASEYLFSKNGKGSSAADYEAAGNYRILYDAQTGTVVAKEIQ